MLLAVEVGSVEAKGGGDEPVEDEGSRDGPVEDEGGGDGSVEAKGGADGPVEDDELFKAVVVLEVLLFALSGDSNSMGG